MRNARRGLSILEVLFATVVVVVGLLGIASILPIAARNAEEATAHTHALSLGSAWADSFVARNLHKRSASLTQSDFNWIWNVSDENYRFYFDGPVSGVSGLGRPTHPTPWNYVPICIDPFLEPEGTLPVHIRRSVFPYFADDYHPVGPAMPDQPRMLRMSLTTDKVYNTTVSPPKPTPVSRNLVQNIFGSVDDLTVDTYVSSGEAGELQNSLPAKRLFRDTVISTPNGNVTVPLRALTNGRYSWMATIVPEEPLPMDFRTATKASEVAGRAPQRALVSFVVLDQHQHRVNLEASPLPSKAERLVRATPLSGNFVGGAGGRVRLTGSNLVSDDVSVGNWIMLGRYYLEDRWTWPSPKPNPIVRYPFFRWYRVIGVSSEPVVDSDSWSREVVLEGPDFGFVTTIAPGSGGNPFDVVNDSDNYPTFGALIGGVVTVIERQVTLE